MTWELPADATEQLRQRAVEHAVSPLSRDLALAAGWIDRLGAHLAAADRINAAGSRSAKEMLDRIAELEAALQFADDKMESVRLGLTTESGHMSPPYAAGLLLQARTKISASLALAGAAKP